MERNRGHRAQHGVRARDTTPRLRDRREAGRDPKGLAGADAAETRKLSPPRSASGTASPARWRATAAEPLPAPPALTVLAAPHLYQQHAAPLPVHASPAESVGTLEYRVLTLQKAFERAVSSLEAQITTLRRALEKNRGAALLAGPDPTSNTADAALSSLRDELTRDPTAPAARGPYAAVCRSIKSAVLQLIAEGLAPALAGFGMGLGPGAEEAGLVREKVNAAHLHIADVDRHAAARYDQLDAAVAALLQSHTADRDTAAGYQDELWQHLRSTSRAIEAAMKELAEDTQRQLQALRGEQLAAQKKRGETEELLNRAACLTDVQTIHDRLVAIEDGAAGLTAEKVRDDFFRLQEQLKDAVAEAEARIQRQLGQESSRRRLVEDRLAEIETDAGDGGRIQPLLAALREEMTDSEHSYRRRLDSQDRILGQLKRQAEDARETSESTRRQLQQLHELLEDTQDKHVRDVSFLEGEVAEVKRFLGLETDNLRRRLQTRAERDHLQALATDHNRFAGEAQLRLDKLEGQAAVLSETATLSELRHQINSNSADVARLKAAAPGAGEIKALKTEIQKELVMLRDSLGSKREADLLQAQQELLESVRDTVMDQVDARLRPLESSNWGAELDSVKVLITKLEKKLGASEDKKKDAADKRELDKLAKELRAVTAELEALRPEVDAATAHAADVRSMFQTFEEEMHRNLPKDLKAHLQKQREEFERLKMELETTMAAAEKRSSFFEDEFARMSNLLTENFDEDEKRANEMRDIQAAVEAQVKRALIDMQALSQACDDQIYEMGKETSSWRDRVAAAERNVMELKGFVEEVSRDRDEPVRLLTERIQMLESQVTLEVQKFRRQYEIATGGASPAASPSALHSAPPLHLPGRRASLTSEMA